MVDIAFLLLIFFMTTTTFKPPEEVIVTLPSSHSEYKVPDSDVLILTISSESEIFAQLGTHDPMSGVPMSGVGAHIKKSRIENPRLRLIVKADRNCDYGTMEDLMDILQDVNTPRFVLMTEGESASEGEKALPTDEELEEGEESIDELEETDLGRLDETDAGLVAIAGSEGASSGWR